MKGAFTGGACAAALAGLVASCESREVFLVPHFTPGEGPDTGGAPPGSGGNTGGAMMFPPSGGAGGGPQGTGGEGGEGGVCETSRHPKEPRPLGVYIMVDQSSAMLLKWEGVKAALKQFVTATPQLGKVSIGLNFYAKPQKNPPATPPPPAEEVRESLCKSATYVVPAVPILPAEDALGPIDQSLKENGPDLIQAVLALIGVLPTESPIGPAIDGAIQGARNWVKSNARAERKAVVLLVTDAIPPPEKSPICQPSRASAEEVAEQGIVTDSPLVRTYVLNVGAPNEDLDAVAVAGGTEHAYLSDRGGDLLPALNLIREDALPCDIAPDAALDVTGDTINVDVRFGKGGDLKRLYRVPGGKCSNGDDEWYYEVNDGIANVALCPATCSYARSLADPSIELVYGCSTRTR